MIAEDDGTVDFDETSDELELGEFLHRKPLQDGALDFLRSSIVMYQERLDTLGITNFSAEELFFLGGKNYKNGHKCEGKNNTPSEELWPNMDATIVELDNFRDQLGSALYINSAYRNKDYNKCVKGAEGSLHMEFKAIDFKSNTITPRDVARGLRFRRDSGHFKGGIGIYNTFVHIDTRGENRNFKGDTTPMSDYNYVFG